MNVSRTASRPLRRSPRRAAARPGSGRAGFHSRWRRISASRDDGRQRGQTLVEFSLVVSFLFLILFAVVDFSRIFFAYATMANGVREGARFAVVHPNADDTSAVEARAHAMMVLIGDEATVTVTYPDTVDSVVCIRRPCKVVVSARSDFEVWTPIIPAMTIAVTSTMHIE
jgi:Flp pilus assembly protein TadG